MRLQMLNMFMNYNERDSDVRDGFDVSCAN